MNMILTSVTMVGWVTSDFCEDLTLFIPSSSALSFLSTWRCVVCSTPLLAPCIGLYTASVFSLKDALIGWCASDCDAPIQLLRIQINTGNTGPSPTWHPSPMWCKQKAFPFLGTVALWVFYKSREFPIFFRGRGQAYTRQHRTWNSLGGGRPFIFRVTTKILAVFPFSAMWGQPRQMSTAPFEWWRCTRTMPCDVCKEWISENWDVDDGAV